MDNSLIDLEDHHFSSPLIAHMADELSSIYLPPQATSTLTEEVPTKLVPPKHESREGYVYYYVCLLLLLLLLLLFQA